MHTVLSRVHNYGLLVLLSSLPICEIKAILIAAINLILTVQCTLSKMWIKQVCQN